MANRVTETAVESVLAGSPNARLTDLATESVVVGAANARVSDVAVEVILSSAAATQRGNIAYNQIRSTARQGTGTQFQMTTGGFTAGHGVVYDANGNLVDVGSSGFGGGTTSWLTSSPDAPPTSAGSLDDEFNGTTLNTTRWSWLNQGGAVATVSGGRCSIQAPANSGDSLRCIVQTAPATPWEVTAKLLLSGLYLNYLADGLCLSDASGKVMNWGPSYNNGQTLGYARWNSTTSFNANILTLSTNSIAVWWYLRVKDDGTNLTFSYSADGVSWLQALQESRTLFFASGPTNVGLVIDVNNATNPASLACDWFRRTV